VEEVIGLDGPEAAALVQRTLESLAATDFRAAEEATSDLLARPVSAPLRLFAACTRIRLAEYQAQQLHAFDVLEQIEQAYAETRSHSPWETQWYVLGWLTLPFACRYPIDVFYLHHLALSLPEPVQRQRCSALAVRYAVEFKDHQYVSFALERPAAQMLAGGDPYYSAIIAFLLAVYRRDTSALAGLAGSLERAASTPLQGLSAQKLITQYGHLWRH
jgi:hypothetical protein